MYQEKIRSVQKLIDKDPRNVEAHIALADLYFEEKSTWNLALEKYEHALLIDDQNLDARIGKALCLHFQERYREAVDLLEETVNIAPEKILLPYILRSENYYVVKGYLEDLCYTYIGSDIFQDFKENPFNTGYLSTRLHGIDEAEAAELIDQTVEITLILNQEKFELDMVINAYLSRSSSWEELNLLEEKLHDYKAILKYDPTNEDVISYIENTYGQIFESMENIQNLSSEFLASTLEIDKREYYYTLAKDHEERQEYLPAFEAVSKAITIVKERVAKQFLRRESCELYWFRARINEKLEKFGDALKDYDQMWKIKVSDFDLAEGVRYYCQLLLRLNMYEEAEALMEDSLRRLGKRTGRMHRVKYYLDLGNPQKAIDDLNWIIKEYPEYAFAYYLRGKIYHKLNQLEQSEEDLQKSLTLNPEVNDFLQEGKYQYTKEQFLTYNPQWDFYL